jgi:serine/threonine protein kinase
MPRAKAGGSVRGYKLLKDFKMAGGGNCEWTFAVKDEREYFIKVFLNPKYPKPDGPGSAEVKKKLIEECEKFERHQRELNEAVKRVAGAEGRLVAAVDFFRDDNLFYKVAHKVPATSITAAEIAKLPLAQKIRLLQNVSTAVTSLHNQNIVHGDLKVDNALLEKGTGENPFIARLIDFDSSYFSGKPYEVDEMVGDPPYYSPELLNYVQKHETDTSKLTTKSDIFALGIVFHQYLTGKPPAFPESHQYLCEAVRAGHIVTADSIAKVGSPAMAELLASMVHLNPKDRPNSFQVQNALREIRAGRETAVAVVAGPTTLTTPVTSSPSTRDVPVVEVTKRTGLRGSLVDKESERPAALGEPTESESISGVSPESSPSGESSRPDSKKGKLKISGGDPSKVSRDAEDTEPTVDKSTPVGPVGVESSGESVVVDTTDILIPGTYRVLLTQLISNLTALDTAVEAKQVPLEAPPRVKGSLRGARRALSPQEVETLSDIAMHLEELQKHTGLAVSWFRGESVDRPRPLRAGAEFVVEVEVDNGSEVTRIEVAADPDSEGSTLLEAEAIDEYKTPTAETSDVPDPTDVAGEDELVPVAARSDTTDDTDSSIKVSSETTDVSGSHRRAERLKNRDIGPKS